ncbi:MAG: DUF983 domain-containing protein [Actinobacteria bacterium]|nr:MAG: DUF983 domain-containing protein [Actinomycetota bacterium]
MLGMARPLGRALLRRCPRCGAGGLFTRWFTMAERCPRCGMRFEREEGFFLGAYVVNFAVTEGLLLVLLMAYVLVQANASDGVPVLPVVLATVSAAVLMPLVFYPVSRTIWVAVELVMRPLEIDEELDADAHRAV